MITNLRPILATHIVTLIIAADKDAVVTTTVMFRPNDDKIGKSHSVQIVGSHEEIDANLVDLIGQAATKVTESGNTLAELDAKIADAKKEKEALLKAEKDAASKKKTVPVPPPAAADDSDDDDDGETIVRKIQRPAVKPASSTAPSTAGLVPAIRSIQPVSAQPDLGDLGI